MNSYNRKKFLSLHLSENYVLLTDLCHQLKSDLSKSAIRRLIENGGVQINQEKITDIDRRIELKEGTKIKIGKRFFFELF